LLVNVQTVITPIAGKEHLSITQASPTASPVTRKIDPGNIEAVSAQNAIILVDGEMQMMIEILELSKSLICSPFIFSAYRISHWATPPGVTRQSAYYW
jgi:hypothetical protein